MIQKAFAEIQKGPHAPGYWIAAIVLSVLASLVDTVTPLHALAGVLEGVFLFLVIVGIVSLVWKRGKR